MRTYDSIWPEFRLVVLLVGVTSWLPALRAAEVCEYSLYSVWTRTSMHVCEAPIDNQDCGAYLKPAGAAQQNAYTPTDIRRVTGDCADYSGAVGVCTLPATRLVFLDGDPDMLQIGCTNMRGTWQASADVGDRNVGD